MTSDERAEVVARTTSVTGGELVLRRAGDDWEVIANGVFLMDTRDGRSERLLVTAALDAGRATAAHVVLGGLGLGTSLLTALGDPRVDRVTVLEHEPSLVAWHHDHLHGLTGEALRDDRVEVVVTDAIDWVRTTSDGDVDALCLDIDNGPDWLVTASNAWLYTDAGVAACAALLRPGGVLAHWSAAPSETLTTTMSRHLTNTHTIEIPTPRGAPDTIILATTP